jgi:hypothetical protein
MTPSGLLYSIEPVITRAGRADKKISEPFNYVAGQSSDHPAIQKKTTSTHELLAPWRHLSAAGTVSFHFSHCFVPAGLEVVEGLCSMNARPFRLNTGSPRIDDFQDLSLSLFERGCLPRLRLTSIGCKYGHCESE